MWWALVLRWLLTSTCQRYQWGPGGVNPFADPLAFLARPALVLHRSQGYARTAILVLSVLFLYASSLPISAPARAPCRCQALPVLTVLVLAVALLLHCSLPRTQVVCADDAVVSDQPFMVALESPAPQGCLSVAASKPPLQPDPARWVTATRQPQPEAQATNAVVVCIAGAGAGSCHMSLTIGGHDSLAPTSSAPPMNAISPHHGGLLE